MRFQANFPVLWKIIFSAHACLICIDPGNRIAVESHRLPGTIVIVQVAFIKHCGCHELKTVPQHC